MKKLLACLSFSVILIIANFLLAKSLYSAYAKFNDLRLFPIGGDIQFKDGNYTTVLIGDSHSANWKYGGQKVLNLGIPSQTTSQILLRSNLYKDRLTGERLIIIAGCNDIRSLATNKKEKGKIVSQITANIQNIVRNHHANFKRLYLSTIPPIFSPSFPYSLIYDKSVYTSLLLANENIRDLCKADSSLILLDTYSLLKDKGKEMTSDGIHMSSKAYRILEDEIGRIEAESK